MSTKIKTVIVGNVKVGKTSIIMRIFQNTFKQGTMPTIGVDYRAKKQIIYNQTCLVQLWDTTGQDKFKTVVANFFRQANGIFIAFDITDQKSLDEVDYWIKELNKFLDTNVPKFLLANKSDLKSELSQSQKQKVKRYCEEYDIGFFKVSAKNNTNIEEAYQTLIQSAFENVKKNPKPRNKQSIFLDDTQPGKRQSIQKSKKGCC